MFVYLLSSLISFFAGEFGCSEEIAAIIAMLQIQEVFVMPLSGRHKAVSFLFSISNKYLLTIKTQRKK